LLFSQLFCFHNHLRCPLVFSLAPLSRIPCASAGSANVQTIRSVSMFRINTCKSVSKQTTSTPFRMNTYEKPGGRGAPTHTSAAVRLRLPFTPPPAWWRQVRGYRCG
jgi:hypothetical protein